MPNKNKDLYVVGMGRASQGAIANHTIRQLESVLEFARRDEWNQVAWMLGITGTTSALPVYVKALKVNEDQENGAT